MKGRNKKVSVVIPPLTQGLAGIQKHAHTLTFAHTHTHTTVKALEACQTNEARSRGIVKVF